MVGAAVITALMNALGALRFPFVFGGDGACFAVPAAAAATAERTLGQLRAWAKSEFDILLRATLVPVRLVRDAGREVSVARYAPNDHLDYAMFDGGGMAWLETEMKAGRSASIAPQQGGSPDLSGLSCRWEDVPARQGLILSLLVVPQNGAARGHFAALVSRILSQVQQLERAGHPLPRQGPDIPFPPRGIDLEARSKQGGGPLLWRRIAVFLRAAAGLLLLRSGLRLRRFDPAHYLASVSANADFRKFDDGLKMTIDCPPDFADRLDALLHEAESAGLIHFGTHRQTAALVTCIVPAAVRNDHMHFIDGASGGYARAAEMLKAKRAELTEPPRAAGG